MSCSGRNVGPGLAVEIRAARSKRRRKSGIARGGRAFHHSVEGGLESFHFLLGADGNARVGRPHGPDPADKHIARSHGVDDFLRGALGVQHETVGLGGDEGMAVAPEPVKRLLADFGVQLFAVGNEMLVLQAGGCRS